MTSLLKKQQQQKRCNITENIIFNIQVENSQCSLSPAQFTVCDIWNCLTFPHHLLGSFQEFSAFWTHPLDQDTPNWLCSVQETTTQKAVWPSLTRTCKTQLRTIQVTSLWRSLATMMPGHPIASSMPSERDPLWGTLKLGAGNFLLWPEEAH